MTVPMVLSAPHLYVHVMFVIFHIMLVSHYTNIIMHTVYCLAYTSYIRRFLNSLFNRHQMTRHFTDKVL
jgi:hypothetical protein